MSAAGTKLAKVQQPCPDDCTYFKPKTELFSAAWAGVAVLILMGVFGWAYSLTMKVYTIDGKLDVIMLKFGDSPESRTPTSARVQQ